MAVPEVTTEFIHGATIYKTLSREKAWRMISNAKDEVTHLFESVGITLAPTTMKCFKTNEQAGIEIESKNLKCHKAIISNDKVVESVTDLKTNATFLTVANEKVFYSFDLMEFEMYAIEKKWDISKVKDQLPSVTDQAETGEGK